MADDIFSSPLIFLLVVMFLFALLVAFGGTGGFEMLQTRENALLTVTVGEVGGEATSFRHVNYPGFAVSHTETKTMVFSEVEQFYVVRGAISQKEREIKFFVNQEDLSLVEKGKLTFNLIGTNSYGALQIYLNGNQIYSEYPEPGLVEIDMVPYGALFHAGENMIEVKSTSSGWRLWAPTEYLLESFTLLEEAKHVDEHELEFSLSGAEVGSSSLGRIIFNVKEAQNDGDLTIQVNDVQIWEGKPTSNVYPAEFPGTTLNSGKNIIRFRVLPGGRYSLSNVELILSYGGVKTYEFNVTKEQLNLMRDGRLDGSIEFNVQSGQDELTVTLFGETEKIIFSGETSPGIKKIRFVDSDVVVGVNTISLSSDGLYNIDDLGVMLWPK
jgi:hypothetical protein